jgi:hypothetical protein
MPNGEPPDAVDLEWRELQAEIEPESWQEDGGRKMLAWVAFIIVFLCGLGLGYLIWG